MHNYLQIEAAERKATADAKKDEEEVLKLKAAEQKAEKEAAEANTKREKAEKQAEAKVSKVNLTLRV